MVENRVTRLEDVFSPTLEGQNGAVARKKALDAIKKLGRVVWSEEERRLNHELAQEGYSELERAQYLNGYYHRGEEVRTIDSVGHMRRKYRTFLAAKAQSTSSLMSKAQ